MIEFHGGVLFAASNGVNGLELWKSDGTEAGTVMVKDINPGPAGSNIRAIKLTTATGPTVFAAFDGVSGVELWTSDGTADGTRLLQDIAPGALSSNPNGFTVSGSRLFFGANDNSIGMQLWAADLAQLDALGSSGGPGGSSSHSGGCQHAGGGASPAWPILVLLTLAALRARSGQRAR